VTGLIDPLNMSLPGCYNGGSRVAALFYTLSGSKLLTCNGVERKFSCSSASEVMMIND